MILLFIKNIILKGVMVVPLLYLTYFPILYTKPSSTSSSSSPSTIHPTDYLFISHYLCCWCLPTALADVYQSCNILFVLYFLSFQYFHSKRMFFWFPQASFSRLVSFFYLKFKIHYFSIGNRIGFLCQILISLLYCLHCGVIILIFILLFLL